MSAPFKKKREHPEDNLQKAVCQLLDIYVGRGELTYFAIPNGGKRSKTEAAIMKGLGVKSGVPDMEILFSNNGPTIFLELKAGDNVPTRNQKSWIEWLNSNGRPAYVVYSVDEVYGIIKAAMVGGAA